MLRFFIFNILLKELVRKCEQHVEDHVQFQLKRENCSQWLCESSEKSADIQAMPCGNREALQQKYVKNKELLQIRNEGLNFLNATVQCGERLQVGTSPEGWEETQTLLQNLQAQYENIFEESARIDRSLQSTLFLWSEYEEMAQRSLAWLDTTSKHLLESKPQLVTTLDEKKSQLKSYKVR